jgi:hypothetical protein
MYKLYCCIKPKSIIEDKINISIEMAIEDTIIFDEYDEIHTLSEYLENLKMHLEERNIIMNDEIKEKLKEKLKDKLKEKSNKDLLSFISRNA